MQAARTNFGISSSQQPVLSLQLQSPFPIPSPPPTCKPEYFTNTQITRSLTDAILIRCDSFILAIFSICPLAFSPPSTDGGNFFFPVTFGPNVFRGRTSGQFKV